MLINNLKIYKKNFLSSLKNLLIFLPLFLSNLDLTRELLFQLFFGFLFFTIVTQVIYITNNYTDRFIDKKNKLKKFEKVFKFKIVLILNIFIILKIILLYFLGFKINFLVLYIFLFYLYNFFLKRKKYLDIILLVSFYLTRVAYGAEISDINLTYEFFAFFASIFCFLAIGKRIIQINSNKLDSDNKIISYSSKDIKKLKVIMNLTFWFSLIIFITYGMQNYIFLIDQQIRDNNYLLTNNLFIFFIEFLIIFSNFYRLKALFDKNQITEDIFIFVAKDKIIIFSSIISLSLLIFGSLN